MSADWAFWIGGGAVGAGGIALLAWALFADRARGRRRCPRCWYDMAGAPGLVCPECGKEAKNEARLGRTRRRWRWTVAGTGIAVGAVTLALTPGARREGWVTLLPTRGLLAVLWPFGGDADQQFKKVFMAGTSAAGLGRWWGLPPTVSRWDRLLLARRCATLIEGGAPACVTAEFTGLSNGYTSGFTSEWEAAIESIQLLQEDKRLALWACRRRFENAETGDVERFHLFNVLRDQLPVSDSHALVVRTALQDHSPVLRRGATMWLANPASSENLAYLREALRDSDAMVRRSAAMAVFKYGPDARVVVAELRRLADSDDNHLVREAARDALRSIGAGNGKP